MKQGKKLSKLAMLKQAIKQQSEEVARLEEVEQTFAPHYHPHARRSEYKTPEQKEAHLKVCDEHRSALFKLCQMEEELSQVQAKIEAHDKRIAAGVLAGVAASLFVAGAVDKAIEHKKTQAKVKPAPIEKVVPAAENVQVNDTTTTINDVVYTHDREM